MCTHEITRYCDGANRVEAHDGDEDVQTCQALCDADPKCNCFSHTVAAAAAADDARAAAARNPPRTRYNCKVYHSASELTASSSGYNAFVKPNSTSSSLSSRAVSTSGVVPFEYFVLAPRLRSGFAVLGELSKVRAHVRASRLLARILLVWGAWLSQCVTLGVRQYSSRCHTCGFSTFLPIKQCRTHFSMFDCIAWQTVPAARKRLCSVASTATSVNMRLCGTVGEVRRSQRTP